jgi:glycosyltransferase involved in cell wall biosynthesis
MRFLPSFRKYQTLIILDGFWVTFKPFNAKKVAIHPSNGEETVNILVIPAHEALDAELITGWLSLGHEVFLYPASRWSNRYAELPVGARRGLTKPDVICCGNHWDLLRALMMKSFKWPSVPIFYIHWWFPLRSPLYFFANNISVCEYGKRYLRDLLGINSPVAYCAVNTELFKPPKNWKNNKIVTVTGNLFMERSIMGGNFLVKIFQRVHELDPEIRFNLIGNNPSLDAPLYVTKRFLKREEMPKYIGESSCTFFTTTRNLIPHSLLISMSCAKNVIAFDLPSLHEVIIDGESGHLIPKFDVEAFSQKIVEISNKPPRKIGEKARKIVLNKCERMKVAKLFMKFFMNEDLSDNLNV